MPAVARDALREKDPDIAVIPSENSAPLSAIVAIKKNSTFPVLITTADHALLTPEMIDYFCEQAEQNGADFSAGLARAEMILAAYPQSIRTFFTFGKDRVSGCNLFAIRNEKGLRILEKWKYLEQSRKKPWRLVAAFGPLAAYPLSARRAVSRWRFQDRFKTPWAYRKTSPAALCRSRH